MLGYYFLSFVMSAYLLVIANTEQMKETKTPDLVVFISRRIEGNARRIRQAFTYLKPIFRHQNTPLHPDLSRLAGLYTAVLHFSRCCTTYYEVIV